MQTVIEHNQESSRSGTALEHGSGHAAFGKRLVLRWPRLTRQPDFNLLPTPKVGRHAVGKYIANLGTGVPQVVVLDVLSRDTKHIARHKDRIRLLNQHTNATTAGSICKPE